MSTSSTSVVLPPLDCSLNLSEIVDVHLNHANLSVAYSFPDPEGKITNITHLEFARAAHRVAHILVPKPEEDSRSKVVAIVGLTDVVLYQTIVMGCIRAGLIPFPISHRNSAAAILHLLKRTESHRLLTTRGSLAQLMDAVSTEAAAESVPYELAIEEIPLLSKVYPHLFSGSADSAPFVPYPTPATRASIDSVALYLHSSGSTGFPKPIPQSHKNSIRFATINVISTILPLSPRTAHGALPPFHGMGLHGQLLLPLCNAATSCVYPPAGLASQTEYRIPPSPTPKTMLENAKRVGATGMSIVPAFLEEWATSKEDVEYLKTLKVVFFGGGPLTSRVGDYLCAQGVNLISMYGSTEIGGVNVLEKVNNEPDAWSWIKFSPHVSLRWSEQENGTLEAQFLTTPTHQPAVENMPDVRGYATNDLFERHPDPALRDEWFRIVGRLDDVIILANGEKAVPGPMEDAITASPYVGGAVVFGRERSQVGVLIEPAPGEALEVKEFKEKIWEAVEEANQTAPAFAKIYKEMILVTHPDKPMARTPKRTLVKKATLALYEREISELYAAVESSGGSTANDVSPPTSWSQPDVESWLSTHAALISGKPLDKRADVELFEQGFDSLNATMLRMRIVGALRHARIAAASIPQNFVYTYPSVRDMATALVGLVRAGNGTVSAGNERAEKESAIEAMIMKYSAGLSEASIPRQSSRPRSSGAVVLLTGSTGGLGSHLLEILLGLPTVKRVYPFNRKGRAPLAERQRDVFVDRGLNVGLLASEKLVYLEGDSARTDLGLPQDVFSTLRDTLTIIIHNAWMLDFNKNLVSFEPHVKGTRNLIALARQSPHAAEVRFLFMSSIGTAQGWDPKRGAFPEELQDTSIAVGSGYGEAKYVSDRILAASGLPATSFRIGQITGSTATGAWATSDWVPALVKSSVALGSFPADPLATVAWISPDAVAQTIIDVALREEKSPFALNVVHPRPIPWNVVMSTLAKAFDLPLVPVAEWMGKLEDRAVNATVQDMESIPAIKLLEFFKASAAGSADAQFATGKVQKISETMRTVESFNETDVQRWVKYWREVGFLP